MFATVILAGILGLGKGGLELAADVRDSQSGRPVEDAAVEIVLPKQPPGSVIPMALPNFVKHTKKDGTCRFSGYPYERQLHFKVNKDGYYPSKGHIQLLGLDENQMVIPEVSVITVALQRVERPIPLFIWDEPYRRPNCMFGSGTNVLEYDLFKADYLPPVGKGEVADITFTRQPRVNCGAYTNINGRSLYRLKDAVTVKFNNEHDGVMVVPPVRYSALWVRTAPEQGYQREFECSMTKELHYNFSWEENPCLCFRVRSELDDEGKVVKAFYGKIYGGFGFTYDPDWTDNTLPHAKCMAFTYYLNLNPMDRNLEYKDVHGGNLNKRARVSNRYHP